jgi:NAD-dependent deacetylase
MLPLGFEPNVTHRTLAQWEKENKLLAVITQNIDGLHQKAGSKNVYELHGTIHKNQCLNCGKEYDLGIVIKAKDIPLCSECKGIVKPKVTLYQEMLPVKAIEDSIDALRKADLLIIAGTSLSVYPAASFVEYFGGKDIVIINLSPTQKDSEASILFHEKVGEVFKKVKQEMINQNIV